MTYYVECQGKPIGSMNWHCCLCGHPITSSDGVCHRLVEPEQATFPEYRQPKEEPGWSKAAYPEQEGEGS